ncbi:MAG TPA: alcohol dehydrogenase, partial [Candidatus Hydrogenedentes bacterium]|nr:alcohol dehydrogenase [Candidatus Hydrogenedentota bacterium]
DRLACLDPATGKRRWAGERYNGQLLLVADMEMLLVIAESGDVILLPATPEKPEEIARFHAVTGKTWNYPLLSGGKLYVRNAQEAACFELPKAGK